MSRGNSLFDCMVVMDGRGNHCRASDLYTKRDTINHRPHSDRDMSAKDREIARVHYEDNKN